MKDKSEPLNYNYDRIQEALRFIRNNPETFLMASQSPGGKYNLEAYRTEPGATVDFSIRVYLTTDDRKSIIYDAYHEYEAKIVWIDNTTVSINGKTLDISQGEKYDWRTQ